MAITANSTPSIPPIDPFLGMGGPFPSTVKFAYQEGEQLNAFVERIRRYLTHTIAPFIDTTNTELTSAFKNTVDALVVDINTVLEDQTGIVDTKLGEQLASVVTQLAETIVESGDIANGSKEYTDAAVESIINSSIEVSDPVISTVIANTESDSFKYLESAFSRGVSIMDKMFGVVGDGVTDDTLAIKSAVLFAKTHNRNIYVPDREFFITDYIDVYNSVTCDGIFKISSTNNAGIIVKRTETAVNIPTGSITGITLGSVKLGNAPGIGTLSIKSTEVAINRVSGNYLKEETVEIVKTDGSLSHPIVNSYDNINNTTIVFHPKDAPIEMNNVSIQIINNGVEPLETVYLGVYRSNVTVNGGNIVAPTPALCNSGLSLADCANVTVNNLSVSGFCGPYGYGIAAYRTLHTRYLNVTAVSGRHGISGNSNVDVLVDGGTFEGGIDDHWVHGMTVNNITSTIGMNPVYALGVHVLVAGSDVTVSKSRFHGGSTIIGIRTDTPELSGVVTVTDSTWELGSKLYNAASVVGYVSAVTVNIFDRPLKTPTLCRVARVHISGAQQAVTIIRTDALQVPHAYWGRMVVDGVTWGNMSADVLAVWADRTPALHTAETFVTEIQISNLSFTNNFAGVRVRNTGDTADAYQWGMHITDCHGLRLELGENALSALSIVRGSLKTLSYVGQTATTPTGKYGLTGVTLDGTYFSNRFITDFVNCVWVGASTVNDLAANARVRSYIGNLHDINATGFPTVADGYRNPAFYK